MDPPRRTPATGSAGVSIVQEVEALFVESVAGQPYEEVVCAQVLDPLGLDHSHFFSDDIVGYNVAATHRIEDDRLAILWLTRARLDAMLTT
jgi:CubicO group peptidase (beta-lactamase class C family)